MSKVYDERIKSYVNDFPDSTWSSWKKRYAEQIKHVAGFEEKFVDLVLSKVSEIKPTDVIPQFNFKDSKGGNRYVDFMIINEEKNYKLPIELDGYSKMVGNGNQYHKFNDFLERQNAMIQEFGLVLRYTNKKMLNESKEIISEIRNTLKMQERKQSTEVISTTHEVISTQNLIDIIKDELATSSNSDNEALQTMQYSLQKELIALREELEEERARRENERLRESARMQIELRERARQERQAIPRQEIKKQLELAEKKKKKTVSQLIAFGAVGVVALAVGANVLFGTDEVIKDLDNHSEELLSSNISNNQSDVEKQATGQVDSSSAVSNQSSVESGLANNSIPSSEAYQYIGSTQIVCGYVSQVKDFSKGTYLNLGKSYPNQDMTIVIWNSDKNRVGSINSYGNKDICIQGEVTSYKGVPQIKLSSTNQIL